MCVDKFQHLPSGTCSLTHASAMLCTVSSKEREGGATVEEAEHCGRCLVPWVLSSLFGNRSSLQNWIGRIIAWFENTEEATGLQ